MVFRLQSGEQPHFSDQTQQLVANNFQICTKYFFDSINQSIENTLENIGTRILEENNLLQSKQESLETISKKLFMFFKNSKLGKFFHDQRAGKNIFRIEHDLDTYGNILFKNILSKIIHFLKYTSFHLCETQKSISIIFR